MLLVKQGGASRERDVPVLQLLKVRLRIVYCWFPMLAPEAPPLKVRSVRKPPLPSSMNKPTCTTSAAVGMLKTMFWRLVACEVGQCMPVAAFHDGMAVVSITKLRTCRKKTLTAFQLRLAV